MQRLRSLEHSLFHKIGAIFVKRRCSRVRMLFYSPKLTYLYRLIYVGLMKISECVVLFGLMTIMRSSESGEAKSVLNFHNVVIFSNATTVIKLIPFSKSTMNTEMNSNDRNKHSKTLAIAGMGFLLIAAAFTFSFANSGQQLVSAQENQTQGGGGGGGNATQTIVAVPFDTFTGNGVITATVSEGGGGAEGGNQSAGGGGGGNQSAGGGGGGNQSAGSASTESGGASQGEMYVIGGNWNLEVQQGNVTNFGANFVMVHPDGTEYHTHNITNFVTPNPGVQLVQGQETTISGTADVYTNGTNKWPGTNTTLTLTQNGAIMTIMPAPEDTDNHFQGQPIYGIVSALAGENGTMIVQGTPPGQQQEQQQQQQEDQGPLGGLLGGGGGGGDQQQGGNQSGGGGGNPLSGLGEQLGNLLGGGQQQQGGGQ